MKSTGIIRRIDDFLASIAEMELRLKMEEER